MQLCVKNTIAHGNKFQKWYNHNTVITQTFQEEM